ncbi:MAG: helix-turn-helix transcriptional regulator [Paraprevotella sp.]|nr:helix-turn-helix transcriptional regulator [Paraprevotella sp.]
MAQKIQTISTIDQYNRMFGVVTRHPLVTVVEVKDYVPEEIVSVTRYGLYAVFLKQGTGCTLRYGREQYDYQDGSIVCFAPGQTVTVEFQTGEHASWKALLFHPDLLFDTPLAERMAQYSYFGYDQREALHVSGEERRIFEDTLEHIKREMEHAVDKHSQQLLTVYVQLILDYCLRFYDRQFITRHKANSKLITRFEQLVDDYLSSDRPAFEGLPSVAWCAGELCLSPNYFGDLVRKELGGTAKDFITRKVIERAKRELRSTDRPVSHISERLGFSSVSHFTRMFKAQTGQTPTEFRASA